MDEANDATLLWDIVRSWSILKGRFQDSPVFIPLNEEVLYGLEKAAHWILEHGGIGSEDMVRETFYAASLACGTRYYPKSTVLREAAGILAAKTIDTNLEGALPFSIVMDMYEATREEDYFKY